jgi:hypothetical protein
MATTKPNPAMLASGGTYPAGGVPDPVDPPSAAEINAPIYAALDEIDRKSIRPAREGDAARLAALEVQAAALRSQLVR